MGRSRNQVGAVALFSTWVFVFRRVVVGLCTAGAAAAWAEQITWLLAVCVCVGFGELLESSYYIEVLRRGSLTPG
jgi:hypothetical protein